MKKKSAIGTSWDEFEREFFTPEEIAASKWRVTIAAIAEGDEMLANGTGERYTSVDALFEDLDN